MKAFIADKEESFKPVTVSIVLESQAELDAMSTLINQSFLGDATKEIFGVDVSASLYKAFTKAGGNYALKYSDLTKSIKKRYERA